MKLMRKVCLAGAATMLLHCACAQESPYLLSEQDYLNEIPVVISVSRLSQRLDETPGAVTILDRKFIRMSGARDVADLLRMVPGFQTTTSFETDAPMVSYHGRSDDWANRIQVLIDGRSVYSGHLQGSTGLGLQSVAMDDIERIEIMRGSNSAAFGARAFLGVINIVSRDVRGAAGYLAKFSFGDNHIEDVGARLGIVNEPLAYRFSVDQRSDSGLRNAFGRSQLVRANLVANVLPGGGLEFDFRAGGVDINAGRGTPGEVGNNARDRYLGSRFIQADVRKVLSPDQDIYFSLSHTEGSVVDTFPLLTNAYGANYYGIPISFSGHENNDALTLQHTLRLSPKVRLVMGGELRRESLVSAPSFGVDSPIVSDFGRVFGNVEWFLSPQWVLNAGLLGERSNIGGDSWSPRLMVNWHVTDGHTLRAGVSTAFRPPSAYEKYADVKYYDVNGQAPITTVHSTGQVQSERVQSRELGYYANIPDVGLSADIRLFHESIRDGIRCPNVELPDTVDCFNLENYEITGGEYQLSWRPTRNTQLFWSQTLSDISGATEFRTTHGAARHTASLALMHTFAQGEEFSLMYHRADDIALMSNGSGNPLFSMWRTDVRVAKPVRYAKHRGSWALTIQNLDMPYRDGDRKFYFDPRAFLTLTIEN